MDWTKMVGDVDRELNAVKAKLAEHETLLKKKALLEATRDNLLALAAATNATDEAALPTPAPVERPVRPNEDHMWKGIRAVLLGFNRPAAAPEIVLAMRSAGWQFTENAREIVRSTMMRKSDVFERVGEGLYALVEWPAEVKRFFDESNNSVASQGALEAAERLLGNARSI